MEFIFHAAHPFFCTFDRKIFTALELHSNTPKTLDVLHEQNPAMHLNSKLTKLPPPNEINKLEQLLYQLFHPWLKELALKVYFGGK